MRGQILPPEIETEQLVLRRWRDGDGELCRDVRGSPPINSNAANEEIF
jgi:hypothetical protein